METENTLNRPGNSFDSSETIDLTTPKRDNHVLDEFFEHKFDKNAIVLTECHSCCSETQQKPEQVLKAAKSLFSKRTRTLYQWMQPGTPKQQLKEAISNAWDALPMEEKELYINQVLSPFGAFPARPVINPQLEMIKNLHESIPELCSIQKTHSTSYSTVNKVKKRRGRPLGSKNVKKTRQSVDLLCDFQDDPELSLEMEQFVRNMYNNTPRS